MIAVVALALVSGLLIGCIGIGGVLLVPVLSFLGTDVHAAIAASMFSYLFSGLIGTWLYARKASIDWPSALSLGAGAMPGALVGALLASRLSGAVLLVLVGAAVMFAGVRALLRRPAAAGKGRVLSATMLLPIGLVVGIGSSLTGTGGPALLVPLLMWLDVPVLAAVGMSQAIQLPIAGLASAGNLWTGQLDLGLGTVLGVGVALGALVGARAAHALPALFLTRLVAVVLLFVGALLVLRAV
jgi:uncharacterized membrane protein YfcA